ncbi:MAG: hypothetical protein NVS2B17_27390 [Candidatus Velthaea sp.]
MNPDEQITNAAPPVEASAQPGAPPVTVDVPLDAPDAGESSVAQEPAVEAPVTEVSAPEIPAAEASVPEAPAASEPPPAVPHQAAPKPVDPKMEERRQAAQAAWQHVVDARQSGETLTGAVTAVVKGGLLVDIAGIRGFLPASQVAVALGTTVEALVKTRVPLKVLDIDAGRRRAVVSHRRALDEERRTKRTELLKSLAIGQRREATVVRLADFGAFVDLGGVDGLIPMSELALERVEKAGDAVSIGEKLMVDVIRIDEGGKKIALSRKNALPDPWRDHADVLRQGAVVTGKVVAKEPRLSVEIAPGVIGSVRDSDADPSDYEVGEAIEVAVRMVDRRTRRITLTTMHGEASVATTSSGFAPLGIELLSKPKGKPKKR